MEKYASRATVSFVLGLVSVIALFSEDLHFIGIICGIIGLVLAIRIRKAAQSEGFEVDGRTKAGFVLSIIGIVFYFVVLVACVACAGLGILAGAEYIGPSGIG